MQGSLELPREPLSRPALDITSFKNNVIRLQEEKKRYEKKGKERGESIEVENLNEKTRKGRNVRRGNQRRVGNSG